MKKKIISSLSLLLLSCGGGESVSSVDTEGFYTLSLLLTTSLITSPASELQGNVVVIPEDRIEGEVTLFYDGNGTPLRGLIRRAELCIEGRCYPLGLSGILNAGQSLPFSLDINAYKYEVPWVVLNPYEDEVFDQNLLSDNLSSGLQSATATDAYYNSQRELYLQNYPVVSGTVQLSASGEFLANTIYTGYDSSLGTITINLVKGINSANSIVPDTFTATAGNIICVDDGAGNIVEQGGGTNCSGTINYTTGRVDIAINNVSVPTDIVMEYRVNGSQLCWDENGEMRGDCTGSVNYQNGNLVYSFKFPFVNVPVNVSITYSYQTGTTDGKTFFYSLPADGRDQTDPNLKVVYGRWIGIYSGNTLLCATDSEGVCDIRKDGRLVTVTFTTPQTAPLTIRFSEERIYDFNPSVDATAFGHRWNGSTTAEVTGEVRVEVILEDGTSLSASSPVTFYVVPQ